jgi:hypothetical protein
MSKGNQIPASDYNAIRKKIVAVMGNGGINPNNNQPDAKFGYGQPLASSEVAAGQIINKNQWDALRFDLLNARIHQDGVTPSIVQAIRGQPVIFGSSQPNTSYDSQANIAISNRFLLGAGQFVIDSGSITTRTNSWKNSISLTSTVSFGSADQARWFFNSGSKIRISSTRSGGANTAQNNSWTSLLNTVGIVEFGAATTPLGFYNLTNVNQNLRQQSSTSPYAANNYRIQARSNIANNSNGGATILTFTITWTDGYVDPDILLGRPDGNFISPDDQVDGTLTLIVEEQRASGTLQPAGIGAFIIARPTYSATAIAGS